MAESPANFVDIVARPLEDDLTVICLVRLSDGEAS
jgi:hypothetical protein